MNWHIIVYAALCLTIISIFLRMANWRKMANELNLMVILLTNQRWMEFEEIRDLVNFDPKIYIWRHDISEWLENLVIEGVVEKKTEPSADGPRIFYRPIPPNTR